MGGLDPRQWHYDGVMRTFHAKVPMGEIFVAEENLGVAAQSNRAIRWFIEDTNCDHLLLCNDDLEFVGPADAVYGKAHKETNIHLFSFCDFTSPEYEAKKTVYRGIRLRLPKRMTGIMMSITRKLVETIGYYDTSFGKFSEEHCLVAGTQIWMADGTLRPVENIVEGDTVAGWNRPDVVNDPVCASAVIGVQTFELPLILVTLSNGQQITTSTDHFWIGYTQRHEKKRPFVQAAIGQQLCKVADMHIGGGKIFEPVTVVNVEQAGTGTVYGMMTETGNYVADGLASKNCDYQIRARLSGMQNIAGVMQYSVDADPEHPVMKHQPIQSTVGPDQRGVVEMHAYTVMKAKSVRYKYCDPFIPFSLDREFLSDGYCGQGTETRDMVGYELIS